jgi:DnaJ-domain-containing protein 1
MDQANYYVTTLTNAFTKLAPYFIFLVGGYFVFIKLPFLFLKKSMDQQKKNLQQDEKKAVQVEAPKVKVLNHTEQPKKEEPKKKPEAKKAEVKKPQAPLEPSPEEVLGFKPGESITKSELKKRYFELLKQNHPDRVASMGEDFKKLADKNTKDINKAYDKLKSKAA